MSQININFNVSRKDAKMFITSIEYVILNTQNQQAKKRLYTILNEIKFDYWKDDKILLFVSQGLRIVTRKPIYLKSKLQSELGIPEIWIHRTLYKMCNDIIERLMHLSKKNKPYKGVTPTQASKCKTVHDIIKLIRNSYDKA
jgi:hypothetical protein